MIQDPQQIDPDSDPEDDPGKLLNVWLGELDNLKKVNKKSRRKTVVIFLEDTMQTYEHLKNDK